MPRWVLGALIGALVAPLFPGLSAAAPSLPRLETGPCPAALGADFHCGTLITTEHPAPHPGRVLHLPFAVHHAGTEPTPTALTFLNGGPGLSAMRIAPLVTGQLSGLPEDIVFLERRGLGLAKPAFTCPPGVRLGAGRWNLKGALACRDHWRALGFDLDAYDSAAAAADLEALRRLLGYRQWDLYGISYGTAYAISAMRDFPRSVRSALLDSVYPY